VSGYLGLIVDGVEEVFNIAQNEIERTPDFGSRVDKVFLPALARIKGGVTALVDIEQVLSVEAFQGPAKSVLEDLAH
jgi:purine-binding chemotaxis protein CheW